MTGLNGSGNPDAVPPDAFDIASLYISSDDDPLTTTRLHNVPMGKPRDFFRVVPGREYRQQFEIYNHKSENAIETEHYLIGPGMRGRIIEARPCLLVTCVDRAGLPRLWPLMMPRSGEKDNDAWVSAREAAKEAMTRWVRLIWSNRAYTTRVAQPGYAPEPQFDKLPPFEELLRLTVGNGGVIHDESHAIYKQLFGISDGVAEDVGLL
jgi:hypothetical protein